METFQTHIDDTLTIVIPEYIWRVQNIKIFNGVVQNMLKGFHLRLDLEYVHVKSCA